MEGQKIVELNLIYILKYHSCVKFARTNSWLLQKTEVASACHSLAISSTQFCRVCPMSFIFYFEFLV